MKKGAGDAPNRPSRSAAWCGNRSGGCPSHALLQSAVRRALWRPASVLCIAGMVSTALALGARAAHAAGSFPPIVKLSSLYPAHGGDGSAGFILNGIHTRDYAGGAVSGAGDINGDGVYDVLVSSAVADPHGLSKAGETYVVFGRTTEFQPIFELRSLLPGAGGDGSEGFVLRGIHEYDYSGFAISGAGDINGDGVSDLLVSAFRADVGRLAVGECYVVFGRTTGFPAAFELRRLHRAAGGDGSEGFVLEGIGNQGEAGRSVSDAGDVNGDGIDDLIISATGAGGANHPGQTYVVFGRTSRFPAEFALRNLLRVSGGDGSEGFVIEGIEPNVLTGRSVSGARDLNGDGVDDVLIGSSNAQDNAGESYVVFGRRTGFPAWFPLSELLPQQGGDGSEGFILRGASDFDFAGYSVSGAGDVNGDGVDDLLIGAYGADPGGRGDAGVSYLVFGRMGGFPPLMELGSLYPGQGGNGSAGVVFVGQHEGDRSGRSVSGAGDANHDGIEDLIIGALTADPGATQDAGDTYVIFGRRTGFPALFELGSLSPAGGGDGSEGFIIAGARMDDGSGKSVSDAGDVNGDGTDDLIIGAPYVDPGGRTSAGAGYVLFGR